HLSQHHTRTSCLHRGRSKHRSNFNGHNSTRYLAFAPYPEPMSARACGSHTTDVLPLLKTSSIRKRTWRRLFLKISRNSRPRPTTTTTTMAMAMPLSTATLTPKATHTRKKEGPALSTWPS
ncbi:hypothetical protein LTR40_011405, partial [Exophiala xenobiotica]